MYTSSADAQMPGMNGVEICKFLKTRFIESRTQSTGGKSERMISHKRKTAH